MAAGFFCVWQRFDNAFLEILDGFLPVHGVVIDPKLALDVLIKTLADYPDLCAQLHGELNGQIDPADYSYGSNKKLWWQCTVAEDHVWLSTISNRVNLRGCPFCQGEKVSQTNSLLSMFPSISEQWHPTKNGDLLPN